MTRNILFVGKNGILVAKKPCNILVLELLRSASSGARHKFLLITFESCHQ